jgi:apoptosis-inducing factor 2
MPKAYCKSVVIVGGGAAGAAIARILSANTAHLTFIVVRPFALHIPTAIRMTTTAEGNLTSIERSKEGKSAGGSVVLSTNERIHYDILVLAPGSEWSGPHAFPDDRAAILQHIKS